MTGDPPNTFVVWIADLGKTHLMDTRGQPVTGKVETVMEGNRAAIVTTERNSE